MPIRSAVLAALVVLALGLPAAAQDAPADAALEQAPAPCAAKPARKGPGLGALLSAANRAGAGNLVSGRSARFLGSGKKSAIAGAVLGSALGAADAEGGSSAGYGGYGGYGAAPMMTGTGGGKTAQIAAVAATAVIGLAKSQTTTSACSH